MFIITNFTSVAAEYLLLSGNNLSGEIPSEIGQLSALRFFDVSFNYLTGSIPNEVSMLSNLEVLRLRGQLPNQGVSLGRNLIAGTLPEGLGDLPNLSCLDVDGTLVTGTVPAGVCPGVDVIINCDGGAIARCECCLCDSSNVCTPPTSP